MKAPFEVEDTAVNRRKFIILCFGAGLSFFTSMSKMLVPGPIYNHLLQDLALDPAQVAGLGAAFMYSYAVSQLLIGVYSNRYGGVRILLIGGTLFCTGMIGFPLVSHLLLLYGFRILTGFGAGIVFIGLAKIVADLFSFRFAMVLGIALFIGYLGPVTGTVPVVWLIHALGWRTALLLPGLAALFFLAGIALFAKGTIKKTVPGQTFRLLPALFRVRGMLLLCVSSAVMFGIYYALLTQVGQKCFEDVYRWSRYSASFCITVLALIVAFNNIFISFLLKLTKGRTRPIYISGMVSVLAGTILGCLSFRFGLPAFCLLAGFILTAIPAGFFSMYSLVAKEINPPENAGLAIAVLNCSAFVFIALYGNLSGAVLDRWKNDMLPGGVFPSAAYETLFWFLCGSALISLILSFFVPNVTQKPRPSAGNTSRK